MAPKRHESLRTCIGCRRPRSRNDLIRIVKNPSGDAVFDLEGNLPGRGAYVCPHALCVDALAPGSIAHVLRSPATLPDARSRRAALGDALERRATNLLTITRKSRGAVFGEPAVRAMIHSGRAALLLLASDLPPGNAAMWRTLGADLPMRSFAPAEVLGRWAGRGPTKVAAVCVPGLAESLMRVVDQWGAISAPLCDNKEFGHGRNPGPARG